MSKKRMKNRNALLTGEVIRATRIARVTRAGHLIARLKPLLAQIAAADMEGSELHELIGACERAETAFAEFRAEYVELYEKFGNRLGENFPDK